MHKTADHWIELIAKTELPAITSTAKMLDKFSEDDVSSLPKLSHAILHDQALSSCILKVANSVQRIGVKKVTTVSRASVVLGIHSVKNICLTSRIVDGLLKSKNLTVPVYTRLTRLMANSFYAGLLAKMMVPDYADDTQEEVYLAAMMYRIGETAFWSTGSEETEELIKAANLPPEQFEQQCIKTIGTSFNELSKGLAKSWNLGDLLVKSLDDPQSRTVEMRIIYYADKLSGFIEQPPQSSEEFNTLLEQIAAVMNISVRRLKANIEQTREQAINLLQSYGAFALKDLIKPLPTIGDFGQLQGGGASAGMSQEMALIMAVQELTRLTSKSKDFNEFLHITLKSISAILGFERSTFLMIAEGKKHVKSRYSFDKLGREEEYSAVVQIRESANVIADVIDNKHAVLINDYHEVKWRNLVTRDIASMIGEGAICFAPVKIGQKVVGVISAQVFGKSQSITDDNFSQYSFLIEHLNMCLTMISHR
ncbi:HDOD domain-containing protein [Colwelliaceae bacterium 6471]